MIYFSFIFHFLNVFIVIYYLMNDFSSWSYYLQVTNSILFQSTKFDAMVVLRYWMLSIQIKKLFVEGFIIFMSFYNRFHSYILQKYFLYFNLLECIICTIVFSQVKDCYSFGLLCFGWIYIWSFDLYQFYNAIYYKKNV